MIFYGGVTMHLNPIDRTGLPGQSAAQPAAQPALKR